MQFSSVVLSHHAFVPRDEVYDIDSLRKELTVAPKYSDDGEEIELFVHNGDRIGLPMCHFDLAACSDEIIDERVEGDAFTVRFLAEYRNGQGSLIRSFREGLEQGATNFMLEAPPGFGKTVMMIAMITIVKRRTLVIVPRSTLVKQWIDRMLEHSTLARDDIGELNGTKRDWVGKKVVVGLVHSVARVKSTAFFENFGAVFFDEVDRSVPPQTFAPVIGMLPAKIRVGASATMERADGMHVIFDKHLRQHSLKGVGTGMKPAIILHYFTESSGYVADGMPLLMRRGSLLSKLAKNVKRNEQICRYIRLVYASNRRVVIMSDRTEQLQLLQAKMVESGIPFMETGLYVNRVCVQKANGEKKAKYKKVSQQEIDRVASDCRIIFATYGMFSIGTDIPDVGGLIYATPQKDVTQSKGRIERLFKGKKTPVLVDFVDTHYDDAVNWSHCRHRSYKKEGLSMKVLGG